MPADTDTNSSGDIFGGWLISQMDLAGGAQDRQAVHAAADPIVVDLIITDLCVMACDKKRGGLTLLELAPRVTVDQVTTKPGARLCCERAASGAHGMSGVVPYAHAMEAQQ